MTSRLNPYLMFQGKAREALVFYQTVFAGELTLSSYKEFGMEGQGNGDNVMHGQLEAPNGFVLMASDVPDGMPYEPGNSIAISLSGSHDDEDELRTIWDRLTDEGTIELPLEKAPWGAYFGTVKDKFGTSWLVNIEAAPA